VEEQHENADLEIEKSWTASQIDPEEIMSVRHSK
jgi:hypothetical protein